MKLIDQNFPFLLSTVENHEWHKHQILQSIQSMGIHSVHEPHNNQKISNTDWHLPRESARPYLKNIKDLLDIHIAEVNEILGYSEHSTEVRLNNYWFQQYERGDYHKWHTHPKNILSNVYYVELPDQSSKTTFKVLDQEFTVDIHEGDIITFPSCILHQSSPNLSNSRKTVISFNLS